MTDSLFPNNMTLFDDDEEQEDIQLSPSGITEISDNVFLLGSEDDEDGELLMDSDALATLTRRETVHQIGSPGEDLFSMSMGEFEEDEEELAEIPSIEVGIDAGRTHYKMGDSVLNVMPAEAYFNLVKKVTDKDEDDNEIVTIVPRFEGNTMALARNYFGASNLEPAELARLEQNYKRRLYEALVTFFNHSYMPDIHAGLEDFLQSLMKSTARKSNIDTSSPIYLVTKTFLEEQIIDTVDASGLIRRKPVSNEKELSNIHRNDNALAEAVLLNLADRNIINSTAMQDPIERQKVIAEVLEALNAILYSDSTSVNYTKSISRAWYKNIVDVNKFLYGALVLAPFTSGLRDAPFPMGDYGDTYTFDLVVGEAKEPNRILKPEEHINAFVEGFKAGTIWNEKTQTAKWNILGFHNFSVYDLNNFNFEYHKYFALSRFVGRDMDGEGASFVVQCDCGSAYKIKPNIYSFVYDSNVREGNRKIQLSYIPCICPHCQRVGLLDTSVVNRIEETLKKGVSRENMTNVTYTGYRPLKFAFKVTPPYSVSTEGILENALMEFSEGEQTDVDALVVNPYAKLDISTLIRDYEKELELFRGAEKLQETKGVSDLAYNICEMLQISYTELKQRAVNTTLDAWLKTGVMDGLEPELFAQLGKYWEPSSVVNLPAVKANLTRNSSNSEFMELFLNKKETLLEEFSPFDLLLEGTDMDRFSFMRLFYKRIFAEDYSVECKDLSAFKDSFIKLGVKYQENCFPMEKDVILHRMESNYIQIAFQFIRSVNVNATPFKWLMGDKRFWDILDKTSNLMIILNLSEKLIDVLVKDSPEIAALVLADNFDLADERYIRRWKGTADKLKISISNTGEFFCAELPGVFEEYKEMYPEMHLEEMNEAAKLSKLLKDEIDAFAKHQLFNLDYYGWMDKQDALRKAYIKGNDEDIKTLTGELLQDDLSEKILAHPSLREYRRMLRRLYSLSEKESAKEIICKEFKPTLETGFNMFKFIMSCDNLFCFLATDLVIEYMEGSKMFGMFFPKRIGLSLNKMVVRKDNIKDFLKNDNSSTEFELFMLNMIFPRAEMNYTAEAEEGETELTGNYLADKIKFLVQNNLDELLVCLPPKFYNKIEEYAGD